MLAAVALNAFLAAFGGAWTCAPPGGGISTLHGGTPWTIAAAPHSTWTRVGTASAHGGSVAYVGYLPLEKTWLYNVFHDDGSFATNVSPGPVDGVWTWTGSYTMPQRVVHEAVQWRRDGATIRRGFGRLIGASFRESAGDVCRR